jgi:phosphoribosylanthranilate isomerase
MKPQTYSHTRVKICGITNWRDAKLAIDAGADALGFNFHPRSPRSCSLSHAREIILHVPRRIVCVGVFVDRPAAEILKIAKSANLQLLQLHGQEPADVVELLARHYPVIKAFPAKPGFRVSRLVEYSSAIAFLLDGYDAAKPGGTGRTFDWQLARRAQRYGPILLAGGLTPANVGQAIREAAPFAVDVASGIESRPGQKDPRLLRAFMRAVEAARSEQPEATSHAHSI